MRFETAQSGLVYLVRARGGDWEYLLLRRIPRRGGFWQGVTGAPKEGEDLAQAAHREVLEETGFSPATIRSIDYSYSFPVTEEWRHLYHPSVTVVVEHVFVAEVEGGEPRLSREHDAWKWSRLQGAAALLKYPDNVEALKRSASFLSASSGR